MTPIARIRAVLAAVTALGLFANANATTFMYKDFDALVADADAVVSGTVANISYARGPDKNLYSFIALHKVDVVEGSYAARSVTLRMTGGEDGDKRQGIVGAPEFAVGDDVILFVWGNGEYDMPMVGGPQGVFRVKQSTVTDDAGNTVHGVDGAHLVKGKRSNDATITSHGRSESALNGSGGSGGADIVGQPLAPRPAAGPPLTPAKFITLVRTRAAELREGRRPPSKTSYNARTKRLLKTVADINTGTFRRVTNVVAPPPAAVGGQ